LIIYVNIRREKNKRQRKRRRRSAYVREERETWWGRKEIGKSKVEIKEKGGGQAEGGRSGRLNGGLS
jgi:hypothetical protein